MTSFTILIPTWNAGRHLDIALRYYAQLKVAPLLIIDHKTTDRMMEIVRDFGCPVIVAHNPTPRGQCIVEAGAAAATNSTDRRVRMTTKLRAGY